MKNHNKTIFDREYFVEQGRIGGNKSLESKKRKGTVEADLARARAIKKAKRLDKGVQPLDDGYNDGEQRETTA